MYIYFGPGIWNYNNSFFNQNKLQVIVNHNRHYSMKYSLMEIEMVKVN